MRSYLVHRQIHDEGKDEKDHDERHEGDADAANLEDVLTAAFGRDPPRLTLAVGPDRNLVCMPASCNLTLYLCNLFASPFLCLRNIPNIHLQWNSP